MLGVLRRKLAASKRRVVGDSVRKNATTAMLRWRSLRQGLEIYRKLSKAKLSAFVVFSTATGFVLASKDEIDWQRLAVTAVGTFGASACANTLNQIYEREKDALMGRTRLRPLPLRRVTVPHALTFAAVCGVGGVALLSHQTNDVAVGLAAGNVLLYAGVYTPLKQISAFNTWVGAVVGAIPPLIGWSAATGGVEPGGWLLFAVLYFWQIPHFLSLSWTYKADYIGAGFRMMSRSDPTGRRVAACAFRNCVYLLPLSFVASYLGVASRWFSYESILMTLGLALSAATFYQTPSKSQSRALFRSSILYLPLLLSALLLHRRSDHRTWQELRQDVERLHRFRPATVDLETAQAPMSAPPVMAPFPFAPLPIAQTPQTFLWDGLDDVIRELDPPKAKTPSRVCSFGHHTF